MTISSPTTQFGKCLKLVTHEDTTIRAKIAELLILNTSKSGDEQFSLKEYVDRMKEEPIDIYYLIAVNMAVMSSAPVLGTLRMKSPEVLYMADPVGEFAVQQLKKFDGKT